MKAPNRSWMLTWRWAQAPSSPATIESIDAPDISAAIRELTTRLHQNFTFGPDDLHVVLAMPRYEKGVS